ncbi:hypothetical protein NA57DRAFT_55456 [Rhizodiscina lignyota]|uniref:Uncharacterized protein n=1 Tax=Rhizodiscina lignyota TaxID=1504668 RepID=A0A9P4M709_9PEZI|nr:hypothetical protein NA57DRAFT_55456 [Rhizodiscina lignyota]
MWEKRSFLLFFTSLCLSQRVASQNLHDARSYAAASALTPSITTTSSPTPQTLDPVIIEDTDAVAEEMHIQDLLALAAIVERAAQTAPLPSDPSLSIFSAQQSVALEALSSAESEFSSVASFLQTFTPAAPSVFASGDTSVTVSVPSATPSSASQTSAQSTSATASTQRSSSATTASSTSQRSSSSQSTPTSSRSQTTLSTSSRSSSTDSSTTRTSSSHSSTSFSSTSSKSTSSTTSTSSSSSTSHSPTPSTSEATNRPTNGTAPVPPSSSSNNLSGGQIAGISVGSIGAAAIGIAGIAFYLRRRSQRAARHRELNQVYPEEAYLYDPPITPPPETAQIGGPRGGPGDPGAGILVTREFGTNGAARSAESFHTTNQTLPSTGGATRSLSPEETDDPRAGLIPAVQPPSPLTIPGVNTAYTNTYPNGSPIRNGNGNGNGNYSPNSPRFVNTANGTFPSTNAARPVAYGLGVSTAAVASQAAQNRSRNLSGEQDPSVAASPMDIRREERMVLSPEGEGGDMGMGRVSYGGADPGVGRVRRAWGW